MAGILPQIRHIIVVMLENRSFDNMCGWLYRDTPGPSQYLPGSSASKLFDGLHSDLFNPVQESYFTSGSGQQYPVFDRANATNMPNPDPEEDFPNVNYQLFGPEAPNQTPKWPNLGFVINYVKVTGTNIPVQIMQPFSPDQVPVISALARNFAVSDGWFSSVPSDTWPNRSFFHAGTSNGNVVNGNTPNPLAWNVPTVFNVLEDIGVSWRVYSDTVITPALTWLMSPQLWPFSLDRFRHFDDFKSDCASGSLPQYSFLEPSFVDNPNDEHPPHDVVAGEQFLWAVWQAVSQSPAWSETLLLITYDEHGGTYDHVMPPWGAVCPDDKSNPGEQGFAFNRFGIRVPMIAVSPWIQAGTVFRSDSPTGVPCDHTSVLATLRDWLQIPSDKMLSCKRIASAPTLAHALTLAEPRTMLPVIPQPAGEVKETDSFLPPNKLQKSMVSAQAVQCGHDPGVVLGTVKTRADAIRYFQAVGNERKS
jgi:phospholipase C